MFAYATNTCCDKNGFVIDFEVTAGNVHDSVLFWALYRKLKEEHENVVRYYVMDAGYKIPVMPYKCPMTKKGFYKKND